ncbi:hypothetical protein WA158_006479 [Blastocystis sp. Blastoise]
MDKKIKIIDSSSKFTNEIESNRAKLKESYKHLVTCLQVPKMIDGQTCAPEIQRMRVNTSVDSIVAGCEGLLNIIAQMKLSYITSSPESLAKIYQNVNKPLNHS